MKRIYEIARYGWDDAEENKELLRMNSILSDIEDLEEKRIATIEFYNMLRELIGTDNLLLPAVSDNNEFHVIELDFLNDGNTYKPLFEDGKGYYIEIE
jgi:hypothetical protein